MVKLYQVGADVCPCRLCILLCVYIQSHGAIIGNGLAWNDCGQLVVYKH